MDNKQLLIVLNALLIIATVIFFGTGITGFATYQYSNTTMNLTVAGFVSVTPSAAIQSGIRWSSLNPGTNNNTALNDTTGPGGGTEYSLKNDNSSNVNVDLYNDASADLADNGNTIVIENVTLEGNQSYTGSNVNVTLTSDGSINLNETYLIIGSNSTTTGPCEGVGSGYFCYIAYWLDVPSGQTPGDYNTTYEFCGVQANQGSGSCS